MLPLCAMLALAPGPVDLPDWTGYLLWGGFALILVGALLFAVVLHNLPEELQVLEIEADQVHPDLEAAVAEMERLGFERLSPGWIARLAPRAVLVPLVHRREGIFGSVYRPILDRAPVVLDLTSSLMGESGVLCTAAVRQAATLPVPEGSFLQILPGEDASGLLAAHRQGLAHLRRHGLRSDAAGGVDARKFLSLLRTSLARQRRLFLRRPLRSLLRAVFVATTGRSRHLGALAGQPVAELDIAAVRNPLARIGR